MHALRALQRAKEEVAASRASWSSRSIERSLDYDDLADFLGAWNRQQSELAAFEQEADPPGPRAAYAKVVRGIEIDRADSMRQLALAQLRENKPASGTSTSPHAGTSTSGTRAPAHHRRDAQGRGRPGHQDRAEDPELSDTEQRNAIISGAPILVLLLLVLVITARVAGRWSGRCAAAGRGARGGRHPAAGDRPRAAGVRRRRPECPRCPPSEWTPGTRSGKWPGPSTRSTARPSGWPATRPGCGQRQRDVRQPLPPQPDAGRAAARAHRGPGAGRAGRRTGWPTSSGWTTSPPACAATARTSWSSPARRPRRKWSEPVPLVDVVRASLSEVENYERVTRSRSRPASMVAGQAVNDVVHLLAELIENADLVLAARDQGHGHQRRRRDGGRAW